MEARAAGDAAATAAVVVVDLRERRFYDRKLMARFYDELMLPAFGQFEDELESFDSWVEQLEDPRHDDDAGDGPNVALHVLLVLRLPADTALVAHHDQHQQQQHSPPPTPAAAWREVASAAVEGTWWGDDVGAVEIVGGTACEYFPASNCGLLTYTATHPGWQRQGIAALMTRHVLTALHGDALAAGKQTGCEAVFLETNNPDHVSSEADVMDPLLRHRVLQRLGWWILDFTYVQPALSEQQQNCHTLKMAVHSSFLRTTTDVDDHQHRHDDNDDDNDDNDDEQAASKRRRAHVESRVVLGFLREFFACLKGEAALSSDPDYLAMHANLSARPFVPTTLS